MDIATIIGMLLALFMVLLGMGDSAGGFVHPQSMAIVLGGTLGATMIANPLSEVGRIAGVYKNAILNKVSSPPELIETIVSFAETARREGILALESAVADVDDEFLSGGIRLAVDGTEPDLIMDVLETEIMYLEERHKAGQEIISNMATTAPAFGMIGTLVGLVVMLANMDDPAAIGPGMAIALLTTLYGAILANCLLDPVSKKLKTYSGKELLAKKIIIEGIMSIQSGDNPRVVETKLSVFLPPSMRPSGEDGTGEE